MRTHLTPRDVMKALRRQYRERGIDVQRLLVQYGIERFLARLAESQHKDAFVLKGAQLLRLRLNEDFRPTRDVHFLAYGPSDLEAVRAIMQDIVSIDLDDGLSFDLNKVQVAAIRNDAEYGGVRARLLAHLQETRVHVQIDIGYGDATDPPPKLVTFPSLLFEEGPTLLGYRLETVIAEKLESITRLGLINGRLKDYYDLYRLADLFPSPSPQLQRAIQATFERRHTNIEPAPSGLSAIYFEDREKQALWEAFLRRNDLAAPSLPEVGRSLLEVYGLLLERTVQS